MERTVLLESKILLDMDMKIILSKN